MNQELRKELRNGKVMTNGLVFLLQDANLRYY